MRDPKIGEEFSDQKALSTYRFIENNAFKPFSVSKDVLKGFLKLSEEKNIPNPLDDQVLDILQEIQEELMDNQKLNKPFIIDENKYLIKDPKETSMVPPLPEQSMPSPAVVQTAQATPNVMNTGLTPTEQALLSEEERMIALKNRGLV